MATETGRNKETKIREDKLLWIAIGVPIVIILLIAAGPALWKGLKMAWKVIFPNAWVVVIYLYVGFIAFLAGRKSNRKRK